MRQVQIVWGKGQVLGTRYIGKGGVRVRIVLFWRLCSNSLGIPHFREYSTVASWRYGISSVWNAGGYCKRDLGMQCSKLVGSWQIGSQVERQIKSILIIDFGVLDVLDAYYVRQYAGIDGATGYRGKILLGICHVIGIKVSYERGGGY